MDGLLRSPNQDGREWGVQGGSWTPVALVRVKQTRKTLSWTLKRSGSKFWWVFRVQTGDFELIPALLSQVCFYIVEPVSARRFDFFDSSVCSLTFLEFRKVFSGFVTHELVLRRSRRLLEHLILDHPDLVTLSESKCAISLLCIRSWKHALLRTSSL